MVRWWRRQQRTCVCGEPLEKRVLGVGQRWGGEPVTSFFCWHCHRCGDVSTGAE